MLSWIRGVLRPQPSRDRVLADLLERVSQLEAREVAHDVAWSESKDQIARHLKRVTEVERRAREREEGNGGQLALDDLDRLILAAKLRGGN